MWSSVGFDKCVALDMRHHCRVGLVVWPEKSFLLLSLCSQTFLSTPTPWFCPYFGLFQNAVQMASFTYKVHLRVIRVVCGRTCVLLPSCRPLDG